MTMTSTTNRPISNEKTTSQNPSVLLYGPPRGAGGGVLAFCDTLEAELRRLQVPVDRVFVGASQGDDTTASAASAGIKALPAAMREVWGRARAGSLHHINTSFTQKALLRDAILHLIARLRGAKTLVEFHSTPLEGLDFLSQLAVRELVKADHLVVINPSQRLLLLAMFPQTAKKIELIANSVALPELDFQALAKVRLEQPRALYLSRLIPEKGLLDSIQAIALLRDRGLNVGLDIAGAGPAEAQAKQLVTDLKLENLVQFHGHVKGASKNALFENASLFLLPSYYTEGQPIAVLEAFAFGLPVICCNLEPVSGLVRKGVDGDHVPPRQPAQLAQAMGRLLERPSAYQQMARTVQERAELEFDSVKNTKRFLELYCTN